MMYNKKGTLLYLMRMVLILLPFTAFFELLPGLNPYAQQLSFYPLIVLLLILVLNFFIASSISKSKTKILSPLFYLVILALVSFFFNFESILNANLQNRTGVSQYITNISQLIFGIIIVIIFCFVLNNNQVNNFEKSIVKAIDIILVLTSIYCFFELLSYHGLGTDLFASISKFFHHDKEVGGDIIDSKINYGRIKGFSQEPSHLGIIFSIYFPFFLFYNKRVKWYKIVFFLFLMYFTFSKTLFLIFIIEISLYFYLNRNIYLSTKAFRWFFLFLPLLLVIAFTPMVNQFFTDSSAFARAYSQFAAITGWVDSKKYFFGEGIGQHGFYTIEGYNKIGGINNEFISVVTGERWPYIQNIHIKILVELGIVGLIAWLYIFVFLIIRINKILKNKYNQYLIIDEYGKATIISIFGIFFSGFSYENFSFLFTWIAFGIAFSYLVSNKIFFIKRNVQTRYK